VRGLGVISGRELLVADSDFEFSSAVVSLLRDAERRTALARAARDWAVSNLSWDHAASEYDKLHDWLRRTHESKQLTLTGQRAL